MQDVERLDGLLDVVVRDDVRLACIDLIAVGVVVMKMRVDDVTHRLRRDELEVLDERTRRGGRRAGVDHEHVSTADDRDVVAAGDHGAGRGRVIDALGNLFEPVRLPGERRSRSLQENRKKQTE
jgi:hypothetical protein